jgi:acetolactate synthase-1/2/3 large subunit
MKVSDYILDFLTAHNVNHVFLVTGGVLVPLVDAFHGRKDIQYVCTQHEQAAAMAAEAYARFRGFGCAMATSGPGATNLLTGIGCAWFDSTPVLYITGQVNTKEARGSSGVRQRGFQETDIVAIAKPITKYAYRIHNPEDVRYTLEYAYYVATSGRPGPVLIDIPIDIQQAEMPATQDYSNTVVSFDDIDHTSAIDYVVSELSLAERPVIIYGNGAREHKDVLRQLIDKTHIPCLPSWAALDLIPHDHPSFVAQFGVYGSRAGNFAVQNADLILAIGTRLDGRMTGSKGFAPKAKLIMVDIDSAETDKLHASLAINISADVFLGMLNSRADLYIHMGQEWPDRIAEWKRKYSILPPGRKGTTPVHPLDLVERLNVELPDDAIVIGDSGGNLSFLQQGFKVRGTQRIFSAYGFSPMGYALPAAIGAHYATGKHIVATMGDGAAQMNIQEWQTLPHYNIPITAIIFNNHSYGIIKQFQEEMCNGRYEATTPENGYSMPEFNRVATAYGLRSARIINSNGLEWVIKMALDYPGPFVVDVDTDPDVRIQPKTRWGNPLHNQSPELPEDELNEVMRETD